MADDYRDFEKKGKMQIRNSTVDFLVFTKDGGWRRALTPTGR